MAYTIFAHKCESDNPGRKVFRASGLLELTVPNWHEDYMIRLALNRGSDLESAYAYAGVSSLIPPEEIRSCCESILRTKSFDPKTGKYVVAGGNWTCLEFRKCFDQYMKANTDYPDSGRMEVAAGVYAPSQSEAVCIRSEFHRSGDIASAYDACCADIAPKWAGAMEFISSALTGDPGADLYEVIKAAYMSGPAEPEPGNGNGTQNHAPADEKKTDWPFLAVGAVLILLLLRD